MCSLYLVVYVIVLFVYVLFVVRLLCFFFSCLRNCHRSTLFFFLMIRRPPRSTRMTHSFPTRRSSDLGSIPGAGRNDFIDNAQPSRSAQAARSEEHTSELQSLMRISYAVFCLKKKKNTTKPKNKEFKYIMIILILKTLHLLLNSSTLTHRQYALDLSNHYISTI